jgi:hypothetical protein
MTTAWSSRADLVSRSLAPTIEPAGRPRIGNFCKILKADPTAQIGRRVETEHWRAVCQCGSEDVYEEPADRRVRLDPYDPSAFRHAGQCEHRYTSDPALLRAILKVRDGAGGGYWWVECGTCECGWRVPHYAVA